MRSPLALLSFSLGALCVQPLVYPMPQAVAQTAALPAVADSDGPPVSLQTVSVSQVRIVRLSQVKGQVELDRKTGQSFDSAFVNLPIVAGAALRTKQGLAEVEFEDNSSLRLTPDSQVEFPRLGRNAAGTTITSVNLVHGSLYISLAEGKAGGDFTVNAGNQAIVVTPSTHLRLDLDAPTARMVVFQGIATVTGPSGSLVVGKRKAISFDTASSIAPEFIRVGDAAAFDEWDKNAVDYHKVRASTVASGFTGSPYTYGGNDLNYYGSFSNVAGCGTVWRPYLATASFDPYSSGVWSWYPGQGYTWVSLYPWGWTPFHSGSWNYCATGGGWGWSPQGNWNSLTNYSNVTRSGVPVKRPTPPPPPVRGGATQVAVNVKSLQVSEQGNDGKFVFRNGSAGLGVPRGVFSNLAKVSQSVEMHGTATTSLSDRQAQMSMGAPSRPSTGVSSSTIRSSPGPSVGTTAASSSYPTSRSAPSSSPSSGSFGLTVSAGSNPSYGTSGSHH